MDEESVVELPFANCASLFFSKSLVETGVQVSTLATSRIGRGKIVYRS